MSDRPLGYTLDTHGNPVPVRDLRELEAMLKNKLRRVKIDQIKPDSGFPDDELITVDTVFLTLDHSYGEGPPVLWETLVRRWTRIREIQERYTSQAAARAGHARWLLRVQVLEGHLGMLAQRAALGVLAIDGAAAAEGTDDGTPTDAAWVAVDEIARRAAGRDPAEKDDAK